MSILTAQKKKASRLQGPPSVKADQVLITEERIRCRAYEIYVARGTQSGDLLQDWLQAERDLTAKHLRNQR
jgi:hypothetical protein